MPVTKKELLKKIAEEVYEEVIELLKENNMVTLSDIIRKVGVSQLLARKIIVALRGIDVIYVDWKGTTYTITLNNNVDLEKKKKEFVEKFYWMFWYSVG